MCRCGVRYSRGYHIVVDIVGKDTSRAKERGVFSVLPFRHTRGSRGSMQGYIPVAHISLFVIHHQWILPRYVTCLANERSAFRSIAFSHSPYCSEHVIVARSDSCKLKLKKTKQGALEWKGGVDFSDSDRARQHPRPVESNGCHKSGEIRFVTIPSSARPEV